MILNSPLQGLAATVTTLAYPFVPIGVTTNNNPIELIEWRTEKEWAEELELLLFPVTRVFSGDMIDAPIFGAVEFELQIAQGAPDSSKSWTTSQAQPIALDPTHATPNAPLFQRGNLWLPDHGLRMRFACTQARLRVLTSSIQLQCELFASFTPCSGMQSEPVPPIAAFPQYVRDATNTLVPRVQPIPKGAREARVIADSGFAAVALYQHSGDLMSMTPASDWSDWRALPSASFYVDVQGRADPMTTDLTPIPAEMQFR